MRQTPRRTFLRQAVAAALLPFAPDAASANTPTPKIRYNVFSAEGQTMVAKYARAVKIMKSKPVTDPQGT